MVDMHRVGQGIAARRRALGLTQEELGRRLNVTHQAVSKWEQGVSLPDTAQLPSLSFVLQLSIEEILGAERPGGHTASHQPRHRMGRVLGMAAAMTLLIALAAGGVAYRLSRLEGEFIRLGANANLGAFAEALARSPKMTFELPDMQGQIERIDQHVFQVGPDPATHVIFLEYTAAELQRSVEYVGGQQ